jgi:hypothetical protein
MGYNHLGQYVNMSECTDRRATGSCLNAIGHRSTQEQAC